MQKFLVMIYTDRELLSTLPQHDFDATMRECLTHADELRRSGRLLDTQMLHDANGARTIRVRDGKRSITDGPFTETKELLAGFNLIEAESLEEAVRIAATFPWAETGSVEVREVLDVDVVRQRVGHLPA
jgi:hypothetical protein